MTLLRSCVPLAVLTATVLGLSAPRALANAAPQPDAVAGRAYTIALPKRASLVDWPQYGFDPGHAGYNPLETTIGEANVAQLQQAWKFSAGKTSAIGQVIESQGTIVAVSSSGTLFALDASTGEPLWTYDTGAGFASSGSDISADQGMVFSVCGSATQGSQGICAISLTSGALVWSYTEPGSQSYAAAPPVVAGGAVFYGVCFNGSCGLASVDELTGKRHWSRTYYSNCGVNDGLPPPVVGDAIYFAGNCPNGAIHALDASHGHLLWESDLGGDRAQGLTATSSAVFGQGVELSEFTIAGKTRWMSEPLGLLIPSMPASAYGDVFTLDSASNYDLVAFRRGGSFQGHPDELWESVTGETSPSIANHVVYAGCPGTPCAFARSTGVLLWSHKGGTVTGVPIVVNGVVYAPCETMDVCAWTLPSLLRARPARGARSGR
jgi:outer membrane protein assembly factor BamB